MKAERVYYRVLVGGYKANLSVRSFNTLDDAKDYIEYEINTQEKDAEFYDYWETQKKRAILEKVTETAERWN